MTWLKRTNENQAAVKLPEMDAPVEWNDSGTAQVSGADAEILIEAGQAEKYSSEEKAKAMADEDDSEEYSVEDEDGGESAADDNEDTE